MLGSSIGLGAGGGGRLQAELIHLIQSYLGNPLLDRLEDGSVLDPADPASQLVFTTDSYVVHPMQFPGGDVGSLAVCGTVNDLAVMGAVPRYLSLAFIIEEGLKLSEFEQILTSIAQRAVEAEVQIITGDTKVVERHKGDKLFINTAGIGFKSLQRDYGMHRLAPGQSLVVNGTLGDHSIAVMLSREGMNFEADVQSDCAPLSGLVEALLAAVGENHVYAMRDLTRGGLAAVLNEYAQRASIDIHVSEDALPITRPVRAATRVLGFEPVVLANEGKLVAVIDEAAVDKALAAMRDHPYGREAVKIGHLGDRFDPQKPPQDRPRRPLVLFHTAAGGLRVVDMPVGELLPRIC